MPRFVAEYEVIGSVTVTVHAATLEEAKRLLEEEPPDLEECTHCSGYATEFNTFDVRFSRNLDPVRPEPDDLKPEED
jgi:hypothetical protein